MDQESFQESLFAKTSGKRGEHLLVFSDSEKMAKVEIERFSAPHISVGVEFAPGRSLHDDEWFTVSLSDDQINEMIAPYTNNASNNAANRTIAANDYEKVVALYKTDGDSLVITKITPSLRVESKTFIGLAEHPEIKSYSKAIEFTGVIDAYYDGNGKLFFRNYSKISSLFEGIDVFYRNATAAEKQSFLSKTFFDVQGIDASLIGMRDSSKIAAILDDERIDLDDDSFQTRALDYAKEYVPALISEEGKIRISDKSTLHGAISVLTESFYKSGIFGEKREAIDSAKLEN